MYVCSQFDRISCLENLELVTLNIPVVWFVEVAGELLFDKFFEHLLQYIDRKVEKVIAQPPKRRMPPRSPLRNYLEVVVVDKYILIKKARKKWAWQDAKRVTFSVTIGTIKRL